MHLVPKGAGGALSPAGRLLRSALAALAALLGAAPAFSQDEGDNSVVQNPAVIVVGTSAGGVPGTGVAVVATQAPLEPIASAWEALNRAVPDFHVSEGGSGGYGGLFAARGLANTPYFGDPAVTVYFADIPLPSSFAYPEGLFGFDSAKVFLGPRGSEFGRATDGAVVVFSPAEAGSAGGQVLAGAGSYDARQAAFAVNTDPRGGADATVFADYDGRSGYIENRELGISVGDQENESAFARLRLRPWAGGEIALEILRTRSRDGAQPLVPLGGPLYSVSRPMEGVTDLDSIGAALKGSFSLPGSATLTTVTSFTNWSMDPYRSFIVIPPPLTNFVDQEQKRWSEELRLRSDPKAPVRGDVGVWLSKGSTGNSLERAIPGLYPIEASSFAQTDGTAAVFGEAVVEPLAGLTVTAGLRAEAGTKDFARLEQVPVPGLAFDGAERYGALLPRLGASWQVGPEDHFEASVAEGLRPGGFSSFTDKPALMPFAPERSTEYSAGWVQSVARHSASLAVTVFYTSIDNLQIERAFNAIDYFVATAPRADSLGAEAEARWIPSPEWTLGLSAGWTRVRLDTFRAPLSGLDESGHEAPGAPVSNANFDIAFKPGGHWFCAGQVAAVGRTYFDEVGTARYTQDAYVLFGLRAGYEARRWTLLAFGENLAKAGYYELIVPGVNSGAPGAPRTFGAKATMKF
jgi:hypothetical protein